MNLSLGEYRALVAKAFRGVGYHWGLTEEAAHAAGQLVELGVDSPAAMVRLLDNVAGSEPVEVMPDHEWRSGAGGPLCPVCVGTSIADGGRADGLNVAPTFEPIVIAPFVRALIRPAEAIAYRIDWVTGGCLVYGDEVSGDGVSGDGLSRFGDSPALAERVTVTRVESAAKTNDGRSPTRSSSTRRTRVDLNPDALATFERFAHRVYAPATEESRRAGAGGDL